MCFLESLTALHVRPNSLTDTQDLRRGTQLRQNLPFTSPSPAVELPQQLTAHLKVEHVVPAADYSVTASGRRRSETQCSSGRDRSTDLGREGSSKDGPCCSTYLAPES
jgi:hypothetical protein